MGPTHPPDDYQYQFITTILHQPDHICFIIKSMVSLIIIQHRLLFFFVPHWHPQLLQKQWFVGLQYHQSILYWTSTIPLLELYLLVPSNQQ